MKGARAVLYGLATMLAIARALLPFLLTTYISFKIRRHFLLKELVKVMRGKGIPEEHAKRLAEALAPDPVRLLREMMF